MGALKGAPCEILSIVNNLDGTHTITYRWESKSGVVTTETLTVSDGDSAYDIAVKLGYVGTEAEWLLSLKGEKGDTGDKGAKGDKGETGQQGPQGIQGIQGEPGEPFQFYEVYSSIAVMEADKDNIPLKSFLLIDTGDVEDPDNSKIFIRTNEEVSGFRYLNDLSGAAGIQGPAGPQGIQGEQGIQGVKGDPGDDGIGIPEGGTTGQVLKKKSASDYDVEWGTGGSGGSGHTIIDNEDTSMTARAGLQFAGDISATDDSTNDKTVIAPHELTQAEMAEIMSSLPGAPTQQHVYSTTEQVVGTWIDGKPVYERTDIGTLKNSGAINDSTLTNVDKIISINSIACYDSSYAGNWCPLGWSTSGGNTVQVNYVYSSQNLISTISKSGTDWPGKPVIVVTRYTKTTDTAAVQGGE